LKNKVFLTIIFALLGVSIFCCATNKDSVNSASEITVTAKGITEGIQINFETIPEKTNHLLVVLEDATENYEIQSFVNIRDDELDTLKESGELVCPFTESGHVYKIYVFYYSQDKDSADDCINVAAIAKGGAYPSELAFDNTYYYGNAAWVITPYGTNAEMVALY